MNLINGRLGASCSFDETWFQMAEVKAHSKSERLSQELENAKSMLVKEAVRVGHNDLAEHYYVLGEVQYAFRIWVRSRDYCSTSKHMSTMCLNVLKVTAEMSSWVHAQSYISKAEQLMEVTSDPLVFGKVQAVDALALLHTRKYKSAARRFTSIGLELGNSYSEVITAQDIATYGTLLSLATLDRNELNSKINNSVAFRQYLDLTPPIREMAKFFYSCQYAQCFKLLDSLIPSLKLDMHLADHITWINIQIRQNAIQGYVSPFSSVNLTTMAVAFNTDVKSLEREIAGLIMDGKVQARIDSESKVLFAKKPDPRLETQKQVIEAGEAYLRDTKALLIRASIIKNDFIQKPRNGKGGDGGGGGGKGGGRDRGDSWYPGDGGGREGARKGKGGQLQHKSHGPGSRSRGGALKDIAFALMGGSKQDEMME